jgi:meso-butanediol dehydrogenase / (S,S)-butanediol dehydrogenase / diacetyl reductase
LDGKVALITGASRGIGAGIAKVLSTAGADVAVTFFPSPVDRNGAELVVGEMKAQGRSGLAVPIDVTDPSSVRACVDHVMNHFGRLDVLANNAGVMQQSSGANTALHDFDHCHAVNLKGVWTVTQECVPHLTASGEGRVVNISSGAGRRGSAMIPAYSASKAAVISLTQSLAAMLAPYNITANTVCPGIIWSPMCEQFFCLMGQSNHRSLDEETLLAWARNNIPLARPQTSDDVGHAVVFFASSAARNITGQALNVDGGLMMN